MSQRSGLISALAAKSQSRYQSQLQLIPAQISFQSIANELQWVLKAAMHTSNTRLMHGKAKVCSTTDYSGKVL